MKQWIMFGILMLAAEMGAARELRIATHEVPPLISEKIKGQGVHIELIRKALEAKRYGPIHFDIMPFNRSVRETAQVNYDAIMPLYWTRERAETFLFSDSYQVVETVFMMRRKDAFAWKKLQDFAALRMGVVQTYSYGKEFNEAGYLKKVIVGSNQQLLRMLENNRIDAFLIDYPVARYMLSHDLPSLMPKLEALSPPYQRNDCHLAVSRKHPKAQTIIDDFNAGLQIIKHNGTMARIMANFQQFLMHESESSQQDSSK